MDKPSSPHAEGHAEHERIGADLRAQIESIATMSRAVGMEPDLVPIWENDAFKALPPGERRAIREWAEGKGYAKQEAAVSEEAPQQDDPSLAPLKEQAAAIFTMSNAVSVAPDLGSILHGEQFKALSPDAQRAFREWARSKGAEIAETATTTEAPVPEPSAPAAETEIAAPERKESGPKPKRREFVRYRIDAGEKGMVVMEDYREWDRQAQEYRSRTVATSIAIPPSLAEKIAADPSVLDAVIGFCDQVRGELDESQVKMYFDRPKGEPEKIFPKWKYGLAGKTVEEPVRTEDLPAEILEVVRKNREYYKTDEWKKWFGRQMQLKREGIVSAELAKLFREEPAAAPAPERAAAEPAPAETTAAPEAARKPAEIPPEIHAGVRMFADKFALMYPDPSQAEDLVDNVMTFSKSLLEYQVVRSGVKERQAVPEEALRALVRRTLLARFEDEPAMRAAIEKRFGGAEPFAQPVDAEEVIEVQDEWIESDRPAETKKEAKESPVDAAYRALREDLDKLGSEKDLEEFSFSLRELQKSGLGNVADAAGKLLSDIEFGKAGPVSEELRALKRSPSEREFFDAHPALDKRNVQRLPDGRVIAHVDRLHPDESLRRNLRRAVDDALAGRFADAPEEHRAYVVRYLTRLVTGARPDEQVTKAFRKGLADYDAAAGELTLKNYGKLEDVIEGLARQIEKDAAAGETKE